MELIKSKKAKNGTHTLSLSGELTIFNVAQLKSEFDDFLQSGDCENLKLDLSKVSEIDTACYQLIIQLKKLCDQRSIGFVLGTVSPAVQDVINIYNMDEFFNTAESSAA